MTRNERRPGANDTGHGEPSTGDPASEHRSPGNDGYGPGRPDRPAREWTDLTAFQRDLLKTIRAIEVDDDGPPTGQDVRRRLEPSYSTAINHGRLYQNLGALQEDGFVRKVPVDGRTNAYFLRDGAVVVLAEAARELVRVCDVPVPDDPGEC